MRRQEKRLTAGRPIGPHQPLTYWRELHPFFGVEIRETELAAGESQRVLGNEIFNLTLGLRIERLVSGSHGRLPRLNAPAVISRQHVAVLIEIGNIVHLYAEPALIEPRHVVGRVELDIAEAFCQCGRLAVVQRLIVEHQHGSPDSDKFLCDGLARRLSLA